MEETLLGLVLLAFVGLLLLLRLDTRRFGAAEHDDDEAPGLGVWLRRLSWYAFGIGLVALIYRLHPLPLSVLHLQMGDDRFEAMLAGLALGAVGTLIAFGYAWWRFGELHLPPLRRYPAGILNALSTSFIDEAAFRGILLGLLIVAEVPVELAIVGQALLYGLITRLAARDRPLGMLFLSLGIGLVGGWLTIQTGGIGAAFLGHALTRMALFVASGHAGLLRTPAEEEPLPDADDLTPEGWEIVSDRGPGFDSHYR
ncbi:MAG TPA: CPBP family intramembrane glutamic endopeptidase [Candidatus Limnocylindria bacterium]|nr:CPBP family intramembrane glutamic endopeptidase [Candidatus Limnocylindria bacterium]